jgi:hypothetical protein
MERHVMERNVTERNVMERNVVPVTYCMKFRRSCTCFLGGFTWEMEFYFDHASEVHSYDRVGALGFS